MVSEEHALKHYPVFDQVVVCLCLKLVSLFISFEVILFCNIITRGSADDCVTERLYLFTCDY